MAVTVSFYKFDGAGNDFVLIDARAGMPELSQRQIARICHRRYGVGADGLMTLHDGPEGYDFEMRYYNSDGRLASMCGNGGRCITVFAHMLGVGEEQMVSRIGASHKKQFRFLGPDGEHGSEVVVWNEEARMGIVSLGMCDVRKAGVRVLRVEDFAGIGGSGASVEGSGGEVDLSTAIEQFKGGADYALFLDTGSPHLVLWVKDLERYDVVGEGRRLRNMAHLFPEGTNVDFIELAEDGTLAVRTYERGVEDETYACGTGVTACALVSARERLRTRGGDFRVTFSEDNTGYEDIRLIGPVACNFRGEFLCE